MSKLYSALKNHNIQLSIGTFFLLVLNYLTPKLSANQENYYGLAKQYVNPNWISNSFSFNEFVGTRFLFQILVGYPLQCLNFETVHIVFTVFGMFLLAFPFSKIFEFFNLSTETSLVLMGTLFFSSIGNGAFWAGEWIFGGFEAKTLAYFFVLWGLLFFLKRKPFLAMMLTIPATYFHFLVGGYSFCFFVSYTFLIDRKFKESLKACLIYVILVAPFIAFLFLNGFSASSGVHEHSKTANWIYTNFRNPHHTAIFANKELFYDKILEGILKAVGVFTVLLSLYIFKGKDRSEEVRRISKFSLYSLLILFVFLLVAYFDKEGAISKLYLFRFGAVAKFISILSIILYIPDFRIPKAKYVKFSLVLITFTLAITRFDKNFVSKYEDPQSTKIYQIAKFANSVSEPDDVFLYLESNDGSVEESFISFIRLAERDIFVSYKFVPAEKAEMLEWYQRILDLKSLNENHNQIFSFLKKYPQIKYVITRNRLPLKLVSSQYNYNIYSRSL